MKYFVIFFFLSKKLSKNVRLFYENLTFKFHVCRSLRNIDILLDLFAIIRSVQVGVSEIS